VRTPESLLIRNLPPRLRAKFKAACARRGRTMSGVIRELMRLYARDTNHVAQCVEEGLRERQR
jgi:plasmid stability protein